MKRIFFNNKKLLSVLVIVSLIIINTHKLDKQESKLSRLPQGTTIGGKEFKNLERENIDRWIEGIKALSPIEQRKFNQNNKNFNTSVNYFLLMGDDGFTELEILFNEFDIWKESFDGEGITMGNSLAQGLRFSNHLKLKKYDFLDLSRIDSSTKKNIEYIYGENKYITNREFLKVFGFPRSEIKKNSSNITNIDFSKKDIDYFHKMVTKTKKIEYVGEAEVSSKKLTELSPCFDVLNRNEKFVTQFCMNTYASFLKIKESIDLEKSMASSKFKIGNCILETSARIVDRKIENGHLKSVSRYSKSIATVFPVVKKEGFDKLVIIGDKLVKMTLYDFFKKTKFFCKDKIIITKKKDEISFSNNWNKSFNYLFRLPRGVAHEESKNELSGNN